MSKMNSVLGLAIGLLGIQSPQRSGKSWHNRKLKMNRCNPEGFRNKPTKKRAKIKAARKFNLKNRNK